jgi:hypothetical protein
MSLAERVILAAGTLAAFATLALVGGLATLILIA